MSSGWVSSSGSELTGIWSRTWLALSVGVTVVSFRASVTVELCRVTGVGRYSCLTGVSFG